VRVNPKKIQKFFQWLRDRGRSEGTAELYANDVTLCLGDSRGVTARLVTEGLAPKTKRHNLAALRAWAKFARDQKLVDVLDDIKLPPPERVTEKAPLSLEEWQDLLDTIPDLHLPEPDENALTMIAIRGFRVGDVCRLSRKAVTQGLQTGILNFRGKSNRQLAWTVAPFEDELRFFASNRGWEKVCDLIAPNGKDRYKSARQRLYRAILRLADLLGIPQSELSPHRLRRTYAVHFLDQVGGDLEKLRQHMGWANISTAAQYVDHSRREELDALAAEMAKRRRK